MRAQDDQRRPGRGRRQATTKRRTSNVWQCSLHGGTIERKCPAGAHGVVGGGKPQKTFRGAAAGSKEISKFRRRPDYLEENGIRLTGQIGKSG